MFKCSSEQVKNNNSFAFNLLLVTCYLLLAASFNRNLLETIKTIAIPLRSLKHSESSKIITFFTEAEGIITLMAKGARKAKPMVPYDTFSLMNVVYRSKQTREIQLLTSAELIDGFLPIRDNFAKLAAAFAFCELVLRTQIAGDANARLFHLMVESLKGLAAAPANYRNYLWFFQLGLIRNLGFGLDLNTCAGCGKSTTDFPPEEIRFSFEYGSPVCRNCQSENTGLFTLRPETLKALQFISSKELDKSARLKVSPLAAREIDGLLNSCLRNYIEGWKGLKSRELIVGGR